MVPRVAMFTMAGETFLIIGDREGTGVSPTDDGIAAETGSVMAVAASRAVQAKGAAHRDLTSDVARGLLAQKVEFMDRSYLRRHRESVPPQREGYAEICSVFGAYWRFRAGDAYAIPRTVCLGSISCRSRSDGA